MKRVKEIDVLSIHVGISYIETSQSHFKKREGEEGNDGGDKPNQGTLYANVEMS
jgi:hypothetical protein